MGKSIGIDLGTTNSVMGIMHTEPEIILNRDNKNLTPSVVAYRRLKKAGDTILVGKLANDYAKMAGKDYLFSIKRLIGRGFDDPEVQKMVKAVSYDIQESPDGKEDVVRVCMADTLYTPREISSMILKKLRQDAEMRLGDKVDSAVITVPAYFTERQKHATLEAGRMAGLKVKKIIDEPTAAAIAFGMDQGDDEDRMVLVFDLGGGTFDVSILLMAAGTVAQMDNEGDMWLGGDDFDRLIMNQVVNHVQEEYSLEGLSENKEFMHELKKKACEAKEGLSSQESAEIIITDVLKDDTGLPLPVEYEISRKEFERLIQPHVDKAMSLVKKALTEASLEKDDIDAVLLVGGSSTIPKFQQAIEAYFGKEKVLHNIDPMMSVAQGASILAKILDEVLCPECGHRNSLDANTCEKCGTNLSLIEGDITNEGVIQRTPKPYGIEIKGDHFSEIIPKNSEYPTLEPYIKVFHTLVPDQRIIKIPVLEGSSAKASENEFMGNIWFSDLPPGLPEGTDIEISMGLDNDMVFTIGCHISGIDWARESTLQHDGWQNAALDEAMETHLEIQREGLIGPKTEEMQGCVQRIEQAVQDGDQTEANKHVKQLKDIKEEQKKKGTKQADWHIPLQNVIGLAESQLKRVRPVLPADNKHLQALDEWIKEAKKALDNDDEAKGKDLMEEWWPKLISVPLVGDLSLAILVLNTPSIDPAVITRLEQAKQELLNNIDRHDIAGLEAAFKDFKNVLQEALKQMPKDGAGTTPSIEILLGDSKSGEQLFS
jgi:molecular chaperone DnaK